MIVQVMGIGLLEVVVLLSFPIAVVLAVVLKVRGFIGVPGLIVALLIATLPLINVVALGSFLAYRHVGAPHRG